MCILLGLLLGVAPAFGQGRFPPPDFETNYQIPSPTTPAPRAEFLLNLDVAVLLGALAVALWLVYRNRSRRGITLLSIFSLAYFGFYRKGCVCAIGSVQNVAYALFNSDYALPITVLIFFLAPLLVALFAGRAFCAAVCPQGALQDLVLIKPVKVPGWLEHALGLIPYLFLGAGVIFAATGNGFIICQYDPMVPFFRFGGSSLMISVGAAFIVLGLFVGRPYCRFLCPYGALLRLATLAAKWRVRVTPDFCTRCSLCQHSCPFGAMREPTEPIPASPSRKKMMAGARRQLVGAILLLPLLVVLGAYGGIRAARAADHLSFGCGLFGGWIGLVIGAKLLSLCIRKKRADFEPEPSACIACARCFEYCPSERIRRGLTPLEPEPAKNE